MRVDHPLARKMSATIDGQAFVSDAQFATATATPTAPGIYVLFGEKVSSATDYVTITLTLYNIAATGTYPLGVTGVVFGGAGILAQGSAGTVGSYRTLLTGASGTVTVSTLSSSRIVGTFAFTAAPFLGGTSTRAVTNGSFDLPVTGSAGTLPANRGASLTARVNGAQWTAAAVAVVGYQAGTLAFGGGTNEGNLLYNMNFVLGSLTGPGTYPLTTTGSIRTLSVISGTQSWDSQLAGTGAVVVTDLTTSRIKGTFTATRTPLSTGGTLTIDNGSFDVGIP